MPESKLPPLPQDAVSAEQRRQQIAQIRDYYAQLHRLDTVAFRLRTANRKDCLERVTPQIGLYAVTPQSLPRKYRSFVREALDITWARPTAISVVEGSPAAQAGLRIGDEVTALNGELIPLTGTAGWMAGWLVQHGRAPVQVDYRRDGEHRTTTVTPVLACSIPVELKVDDAVNAHTDGKKIVMHSAIVALARTDAQLAAVVGHEMAHANLGHLDKKTFNMRLGMIGGAMVDGGLLLGGISTGGAFTRHLGAAGANAYSVGFEREADYVGAYYMARAGYSLEGVEEFWRAMGLAHPDSIRFSTTHPATPIRAVQMQMVAKEIAEKKRRGLPLDPELKTIRSAAPDPPSREVTY
ncbi:MAG: M48 family metalloprotease [Pseudolabrys sp.]